MTPSSRIELCRLYKAITGTTLHTEKHRAEMQAGDMARTAAGYQPARVRTYKFVR